MKFADGDGFLDVIIYIIIMVVGIAASAYRNYTKRKEAEQRKAQGDLYPEFPEVETERVLDEEIFDEEPEYYDNPFNRTTADAPEITGTHQPVIPEPLIQTIDKESQLDRPVSEVEVPESVIDTVPQSTTDSNVDTYVNRDDELPDDISMGDLSYDEIHDSVEAEDLSESFDVKKAIIYSEIINRKYI
jgi:hypothetical protein